MVFSGLVTAWRFAGWPVIRSPSSEKATIEGVVRMPSAFSMTFGVLPSITATHELVVPRSMPMTLPIVFNPLFCGRSAGPVWHPGGAFAMSAKPLRPPEMHTERRPRGVLAHIGGLARAARQRITNRTLAEEDVTPRFQPSLKGPRLRART